MKRFLRILVKILYILPLLVCAGIGLLITLVMGILWSAISSLAQTDVSVEMTMTPEWIGLIVLMLLPGLLPLAGSILLMCRKWWGCFLGVFYGAGLALLNSDAFLGTLLDGTTRLILGLGLVIYYGAMGMLCAWQEERRKLPVIPEA